MRNATIRGGSVHLFRSSFVGLYALLLSIGCSGWLRSRAAGWATGISAGVAALLGTWALAGF